MPEENKYSVREHPNPMYRDTHVQLHLRGYGAMKSYKKTELRLIAAAFNLYLVKEAHRAT